MTSKATITTRLAFAAALVAALLPTRADAALSVITTTTDLMAIVAEVGGGEVEVESFCKGPQDPHFLEAKPSFMVKVSQADLIVSVGLGLEVGWLPNIVTGGRNPKVMPGQPGYLEAGTLVDVLEVASGRVTRAEGDVHPEGNPHVTLDPLRVGQIALGIAERLAVLDPAHAAQFKVRAETLKARLDKKTKDWEKRIGNTGVTKVVTYHKTLSYFLDRFKIQTVAILEPLPGVPPTAKHILGVIRVAREAKVGLIMVENYFDETVAARVAQEVAQIRVVSVPVAVEGADGVKTLDDLFERIVLAVEGKAS